MKASRLLSILISLQGGHRVTAEALARRFEVSKRTIYRDLDELSAAGVPVRADRGVGGGIALEARYTTDLSGMSPGEAGAIAFTGLPELAAQLGMSVEARSARSKLLGALGGAAAEMAERFHLDPSEWYDRVGAPPALRAVATAVAQRRGIRISYSSWQGEGTRSLDPLGLVVKGGQWYFLGCRDGRTAIYRVAAISDISVEERRFIVPQGFDLAREWRNRITAFERSLERLSALIRVWPHADDRIYRLGAAAKTAIEAAQRNADGSRLATVPLEGIAHAASVLLGFADAIEVVEPNELRNEIAARASSVVQLYGPKRSKQSHERSS